MIKKILYVVLGLVIGASALNVSAQTLRILTAPQGGTGLGSATAGDVNKCLTVLDDSPFTYAFSACGGGSGTSGGTWSTTTSQVSGQFINYPNNGTDVVTIGSNASTSAEFFFDPNLPFAKINNQFFGLSSTTLQNFTAASGTISTLLSLNATSTNLHVSGLASTTALRSNTALFGGRVGIGGTSPSYLFDINAGVAGDRISRIYNSSATGWGLLVASKNTATTDKIFEVLSNDGADTVIAAQANGKVGIGTYSPLSLLHVGDGTSEYAGDVAINVARNLTGTGTGSGHGVNDSTDIDRTGGVGYNSFGASTHFLGAENYDHYAAFQTQPNFSAGTMTDLFGYSYTAIVEAGATVTNAYGVYINDTSGAGSVTNNYGIYQLGSQKNYFNGNIGLGTFIPESYLNGGVKAFIIKGTSNGYSDGNQMFSLASGVVAGHSQFAFGVKDGDYSWMQHYTSGGSAYKVAINPIGGAVGIATTSPFQAFSVAGNTYLGGHLVATGTAQIGSLAGVGTRCVNADANGIIGVAAADCGTSAGSFAWPFTKQAGGEQATSTVMGLYNGFLSLASSTVNSNFLVAGSSTLQKVTMTEGTTTTAFATPALNISGISGSTQCLHVDTVGHVTGTGSDCGSGGSSFSWPFTKLATGEQATSTTMQFSNFISTGSSTAQLLRGDMWALGTTTARWLLQLSTTSVPQLTLSDSGAITSNHFSFRNSSGILYLSTSSPTSYATGTNPILTFNGTNGAVGIGTSSPNVGLHVVNGAILNQELVVATSATMTINLASSTSHLVKIGTGATTITLSTAVPIGTLHGLAERVVVCNPDAGTAGAITWATGPATGLIRWTGGSQPVQTTTANKCDMWTFTVTGGATTTVMLGSMVPNH